MHIQSKILARNPPAFMVCHETTRSLASSGSNLSTRSRRDERASSWSMRCTGSKENTAWATSRTSLALERSHRFAAVYHCKHQHRCERLRRVVAVTVKPGDPSIATCLDDAARLAGYSVWEVEINQPLSINVVSLVFEDKKELPLQMETHWGPYKKTLGH